MLTWNECVRAAWMLAGRQQRAAAETLASAGRLLEQSARSTDHGFRWHRILAPHHGLTVSPRHP